MITEYVRYRIPADRADEFVSAYQQAATALDASPFCLDFELGRCEEEPERFILRIHWTSVAEHLNGFRKSREFPGFFAAVQPFIEHIEEMQHYGVRLQTRRSVYDTLGGAGVFFGLAQRIHEEIKRDEALAPMFAHVAETHIPHLGMWLCEVFGGPALYTNHLQDISPMLARHAGLEITEEQRQRFVACASRAVRELITHADARDAIIAYFEWGSKIAVANARVDHVPDPKAGVPKWGWGESQ